MARQKKDFDRSLKELRNKVQNAIKRLDHSIEVLDRKYRKELADYERLYGKYGRD
jgi:hypothetical protein